MCHFIGTCFGVNINEINAGNAKMGLHSFSKECLFVTGLLRKMEWKKKESFEAEKNKIMEGRNRGPQ